MRRYVTPMILEPTVPDHPTPKPRVRQERWHHVDERSDPDQRYFVYRLCDCSLCDGSGRVDEKRCPDCRGEGRALELIATCETPEALGIAIVTLGAEGELADCPLGVLDTQGEPGKKWIVSPWLPSPRNVSDAGRVLQSAQRRER